MSRAHPITNTTETLQSKRSRAVPVWGLAAYKVRGQWPLKRGDTASQIEQQKVMSRNEGRS